MINNLVLPCDLDCNNGVCTGPDTCQCSPRYTGARCETGRYNSEIKHLWQAK